MNKRTSLISKEQISCQKAASDGKPNAFFQNFHSLGLPSYLKLGLGSRDEEQRNVLPCELLTEGLSNTVRATCYDGPPPVLLLQVVPSSEEDLVERREKLEHFEKGESQAEPRKAQNELLMCHDVVHVAARTELTDERDKDNKNLLPFCPSLQRLVFLPHELRIQN